MGAPDISRAEEHRRGAALVDQQASCWGRSGWCCAATASPALWPLYARLFGRGGAVRLVASLLLAALLAGLATAWIFGATELTIRYRLIPEQLWEVP